MEGLKYFWVLLWNLQLQREKMMFVSKKEEFAKNKLLINNLARRRGRGGEKTKDDIDLSVGTWVVGEEESWEKRWELKQRKITK